VILINNQTIYTAEKRLHTLALKELNAFHGGFGGLIDIENLIPGSNFMVVLGAIVSPYYKELANQEEIDKFLQRSLRTTSSGLGPISAGYERNAIIDELEILLKKFKK